MTQKQETIIALSILIISAVWLIYLILTWEFPLCRNCVNCTMHYCSWQFQSSGGE